LRLRRFTYRKERDELSRRGKAETMTTTKTHKMKALAVGAAMTLVLGAGATVLLMPSASAAVARPGADAALGPVRHSRADDTLGHLRSSGRVRPGGHRADDTLGHVRHSGIDDTAVPMTRSGTPAAAAAQSVRPDGVSAPGSGASTTAVSMWRTFVLGFIVAVIASVLLIGVAQTVSRTADMVRKSVRGRGRVLTS